MPSTAGVQSPATVSTAFVASVALLLHLTPVDPCTQATSISTV